MSIVEPPVSAADIPAWDRTAEFVVIGLGIAGSAAALEAQELGIDVLVIERASGGGGASALSQGIFYFGGGTDVQSACGYEDSPENMYAFLRAVTTTTDEVWCLSVHTPGFLTSRTNGCLQMTRRSVLMTQ